MARRRMVLTPVVSLVPMTPDPPRVERTIRLDAHTHASVNLAARVQGITAQEFMDDAIVIHLESVRNDPHYQKVADAMGDSL